MVPEVRYNFISGTSNVEMFFISRHVFCVAIYVSSQDIWRCFGQLYSSNNFFSYETVTNEIPWTYFRLTPIHQS